MAQKQCHRDPKLNTVHHVDQEGKSSTMPEVISLYKENQVVEEKQSYAMITGLLQFLVASIAYQRDLFPKTCFEMRLPSMIRAEARRSYEQADDRSERTNGDNEMAHFASVLAQQDLPLIVLAPGKTKGVDRLLAWLDEIFKGLLDRCLDGVQFSIYADKSKPSKILELYTFSFHYRKRKDGERRLVGLTAPGRDSGTITTRSVTSGMVNVIDQLHDYQQQLPALPKERYLMCHLFHSPYAPPRRRPSGFRSCMDTSMAVIENGAWHMKQQSFGSIDSGFHRVRLEIDFMARTDDEKGLDDQPVLAQNMEYTRIVPRTVKPDLEMRSTDQADPPVSIRSTKRPNGDFARIEEQENSIRLEELSQSVTEDLDKWTRATRPIASQGPFSKDSGESVRLSGSSLLPTQIMEVREQRALPTWNWRLRSGKEMLMGVKITKQQWAAAQDDRIVRCECSCDQEELPMLQCICCLKLQHYHCYGFALKTHVHEHYCYQCLLEDTHDTLLRDMKSLAIFRRALWILYEQAPSSSAEFAQKMQSNGKTTQGLIGRLDEGGYLAAGRTRLCPVTTPEQKRFMSQLYHNPLTSISGFYVPRETSPAANTDTEDEKARCKRRKK